MRAFCLGMAVAVLLMSTAKELQAGLQSLMGLVLPMSGCPHTACLAPLAEGEIPLAEAETP